MRIALGYPVCRPVRASRLLLALLLLHAAAISGCRLTSDVAFEHPSAAEQNRAILEIAPYGSTRLQAVDALRQAGVQGTFGVSETVYYCDMWEREDGRRWHLDVALYFDQSGRLYEVGQSQSDTGVLSAANDSSPAASIAKRTAATGDDSQSAPLPPSRRGRRTPFAEPDSLR